MGLISRVSSRTYRKLQFMDFEYNSDSDTFIFESSGRTRSSKLKKMPHNHEIFQHSAFTTEWLENNNQNKNNNKNYNKTPEHDETSLKLFKKILTRVRFMFTVYRTVDFKEDLSKFG